jgi:peptidoglycan/LPS O-acetylase OafA/YrhL
MTEIRSLTGLRGYAALLVFISHMYENLLKSGFDLPVPLLIQRLFLMGGRQVDIFFVLSGFIMTLIYKDWFAPGVTARSYWKFQSRRFARVYPLHFFMLTILVGLVVGAMLFKWNTAFGLDNYNFAALPYFYTLTQAWGIVDPGIWNAPAWSVSVEAAAYLVFPFFIRYTWELGKSRPWTVFIVLAVAGYLANTDTFNEAISFLGFPPPQIIRGLTEFALGCVTVHFMQSRTAAWLQTPLGAFAALAGLAVCFALTADLSFMVAVFTVPLLLALLGDTPLTRIFDNKPVWFLGEISFSIYLGHFLFTSASHRIISQAWMKTGTGPLILGILGTIALVLLLSTLTFYTVERPGRDLLRGLTRVRAASAPRPARSDA